MSSHLNLFHLFLLSLVTSTDIFSWNLLSKFALGFFLKDPYSLRCTDTLIILYDIIFRREKNISKLKHFPNLLYLGNNDVSIIYIFSCFLNYFSAQPFSNLFFVNLFAKPHILNSFAPLMSVGMGDILRDNVICSICMSFYVFLFMFCVCTLVYVCVYMWVQVVLV